ncbi:MAG: phage integrase N-terminal SAM-like domain-containing protein [Chromatiaceae bacterium]|nr:phage integrase N-terminal SAM-like domain-containing protein [Chromatiaceae bacterium]
MQSSFGKGLENAGGSWGSGCYGHSTSARGWDAYIGRIKRFIYFHGKRHSKDLREGEVEAFLMALATERGGLASTQNQALCALRFLYKQGLGEEIGWVMGLCGLTLQAGILKRATPHRLRHCFAI